jgi:hydrogenase maturation protein HypF
MDKEPRLSALSILRKSRYRAFLRDKFTDSEWGHYDKLLTSYQPLYTSSAGRLFDAAACLLGLSDTINYEGEGALLLEELAYGGTYKRLTVTGNWLDPQSQLELILKQMNDGIDKEQIAWNFHYQMVMAIREAARHRRIKRLAFSGGVFQNALLVDMLETLAGPENELYFHQSLSPNDENISFGQLMHYEIQKRRSVTSGKLKMRKKSVRTSQEKALELKYQENA